MAEERKGEGGQSARDPSFPPPKPTALHTACLAASSLTSRMMKLTLKHTQTHIHASLLEGQGHTLQRLFPSGQQGERHPKGPWAWDFNGCHMGARLRPQGSIDHS